MQRVPQTGQKALFAIQAAVPIELAGGQNDSGKGEEGEGGKERAPAEMEDDEAG